MLTDCLKSRHLEFWYMPFYTTQQAHRDGGGGNRGQTFKGFNFHDFYHYGLQLYHQLCKQYGFCITTAHAWF